MSRWIQFIWEHRPSRGTLFFLAVLIGMGWAGKLFFATPPRTAVQVPTLKTVAPPDAQPTAAYHETDRIILSLFSPPESELAQRSADDALRARYRTVYIALYLLKGCGHDIAPYHRTTTARFYGEATGGASQENYALLSRILEDASSRYSLLYQNTPCEKRNLGRLEAYFEGLSN